MSTGTYPGSICSGLLIVNSLVRVIRGNGHKRTALMAEETNFRCGSRILTWGWGSNLEVSGTRGREPLFSFEGGTRKPCGFRGRTRSARLRGNKLEGGPQEEMEMGNKKKKRRCLLESPDTKTLAKNGVLEESVRSKWMAPNRNAFLVLI